MKNISGGTFFRRKGFFIALYSCLGVVAVLALVVTLANRPQSPTDMEIGYDFNEEAAPVGADQVEPYMAGIDEEAWFRPRQPAPQPPPEPTPTPRPTPPAPNQLSPSVPEPELPPEPPTPEPTPAPTEQQAEQQAVAYPARAYAVPQLPAPAVAAFTPFSDTSRMLWPLYGETVMPFSVTALIYDPTLDQFRTNDNLRIAGEFGDPVRAGADGRVIATGRNARQGNYITIDHGNGWVTTYGQLLDAIMVGSGDIVRAGQVIGGIGEPSIFGVASGNHVQLRIKHDDVAVNPYYILAERSDS